VIQKQKISRFTISFDDTPLIEEEEEYYN